MEIEKLIKVAGEAQNTIRTLRPLMVEELTKLNLDFDKAIADDPDFADEDSRLEFEAENCFTTHNKHGYPISVFPVRLDGIILTVRDREDGGLIKIDLGWLPFSDLLHISQLAMGFIDSKNHSIKNWYISTYPDDSVGATMKLTATFSELWEAPKKIYELLGGDTDSVVRERVFQKLSELYDVDYKVIYDKWLDL